MEGLADASSRADIDIIITGPNRDQGSQHVESIIRAYLHKVKNCFFVQNLGGFRYHSLLSLSKTRPVIVCGNSSSVIKESPFFSARSEHWKAAIGERKGGTQVDVEIVAAR